LTRIINGISVSTGSLFYRYCCASQFWFCSNNSLVLGTNKLQIFTASFNSPPGLSLSSIMRSAPCFFSSSSASLVSLDAFLLKWTKQYSLFIVYFLKGTDLISTSSKTIWVLGFPCRMYLISILVFFAPLKLGILFKISQNNLQFV
jgi:hypothetical protein